MSTQVSPSDYEDVEYMLVDPSCSGSGIVGRVNYEQVSSRLFICLISTIALLEEAVSIVSIRMIQFVKTRGCKGSVGFRQAFLSML